MAGFCALPSGSTEAGAWPEFVWREGWIPRWELPGGAEDMAAPWTALTPRVLHMLMPAESSSEGKRLRMGLETVLKAGCVAVIGPVDTAEKIPELRLGTHVVPGIRLDIGKANRPGFVFCLNEMQQAALVIGAPRMGWQGVSSDWSLSGPLQDGLRVQLPEAIQFAATFVD